VIACLPCGPSDFLRPLVGSIGDDKIASLPEGVGKSDEKHHILMLACNGQRLICLIRLYGGPVSRVRLGVTPLKPVQDLCFSRLRGKRDEGALRHFRFGALVIDNDIFHFRSGFLQKRKQNFPLPLKFCTSLPPIPCPARLGILSPVAPPALPRKENAGADTLRFIHRFSLFSG
jgi:hypothetical protein